MWKRCYVNDFSNFNTSTVYSSDRGLTAITRTFYISFYLSETQIVCHFSTILCCHLCCIRSILLRTSESHLTC